MGEENRKVILQSIGEKWRQRRDRLFHAAYDGSISREELVNEKRPRCVPEEQWPPFIRYRFNSKTKVIMILILCYQFQSSERI